MALDPHLLDRARTAGRQLREAERAALLARADYHTAIRRLHLAGGSLREIAGALSLSHQRVQQVVSAAGGSWWQVWRRRGATRNAVCSWCDRSPAEVSKLIAGPNVYICDSCVEAAEHAVHAGLSSQRATARQRCTFCGKRGTDTRRLVTGPANVCTDCLAVCRDILNGRRT